MIERSGCGVIGEARLSICDLWCRLPWYIVRGESLGSDIKKWFNRLNLDREDEL